MKVAEFPLRPSLSVFDQVDSVDKRKYHATRMFYHTSNIVPSYGTLEILATFT